MKTFTFSAKLNHRKYEATLKTALGFFVWGFGGNED
jgi:hypothetical protein